MFNHVKINQLLATHSHRVLALMLLSLHALLIWGEHANYLQQTFFLCTYGLFLAWQPVWLNTEKLSTVGCSISTSGWPHGSTDFPRCPGSGPWLRYRTPATCGTYSGLICPSGCSCATWPTSLNSTTKGCAAAPAAHTRCFIPEPRPRSGTVRSPRSIGRGAMARWWRARTPGA